MEYNMKIHSVILIVIGTVIVTALGEYALLRGAFWSRFHQFKEESLRANMQIADERSQKEQAYKMYHALSEAYRQRDAYLKTLSPGDRSVYESTLFNGGMNISNGQFEIAFSSNDLNDAQISYIIHVVLKDNLSLVRISHGTTIK
jgi:hypothetical protein